MNAPAARPARWENAAWAAGALGIVLFLALHGAGRLRIESDLRTYAWEFQRAQIHLLDALEMRRALAGGEPYEGTGANPGLDLLLASIAAPSPFFFDAARRANLGVACCAAAAFLLFARRRFGAPASLASGTLLVLSGPVALESARVCAEPLLLLGVVLAWSLAGERRWGLAGLAAGAAWTAKGSGLALLPALAAAALAEGVREKAPRRGLAAAALATLAFAAASAPLWTGTLRGPRPPGEGPNWSVLWRETRDGQPTGSVVRPWSAAAAERLADGLVRGAEVLARALLPSPDRAVRAEEMPWRAKPPKAQPAARAALWAAALAVLACAVLALRTGRDAAAPWMLGAFFLPTAWSMEVFGAPRFFVPMVPLALACLAAPLSERGKGRAWATLLLAALAAALPAWRLAAPPAPPNEIAAMLDRLRAALPEDGRCAFLPARQASFVDLELLAPLLSSDLELQGAPPEAYRAAALARGTACVFLESAKAAEYDEGFRRFFTARGAEREALFAGDLAGYALLAEPERHLRWALLAIRP